MDREALEALKTALPHIQLTLGTMDVDALYDTEKHAIEFASVNLPKLLADSERLNALQALMFGLDFQYGEENDQVVLLSIPAGIRVGNDIRAFADDCIAAKSARAV